MKDAGQRAAGHAVNSEHPRPGSIKLVGRIGAGHIDLALHPSPSTDLLTPPEHGRVTPSAAACLAVNNRLIAPTPFAPPAWL